MTRTAPSQIVDLGAERLPKQSKVERTHTGAAAYASNIRAMVDIGASSRFALGLQPAALCIHKRMYPTPGHPNRRHLPTRPT